MAGFIASGTPEKQVLDDVVLIGDDDVGSRAAVEAEKNLEPSAVVVQIPDHCSVERKLGAGEDDRTFQILAGILLEALEFLRLGCLGSRGKDVKPALGSTDFGVEKKTSALSIVEFPGHGVERALNHALYLGAIEL